MHEASPFIASPPGPRAKPSMMLLRKLWCIIGVTGHGLRLVLAGLFGLSIAASLLEMLGIGLFLPLLRTLSAGDFTGDWEAWLYRLGHFESRQQFLVALCVILVALFTVKNAFLALITFLQNDIVQRHQAIASRLLFGHYLRQPYGNHLSFNSAELLRNITSSVYTVFTNGLLPYLNILLEGVLALAAFTVLMMVEPVGTTIVLGVLGVTGVSFYLLVRNRMADWGRQAESVSERLIRWVHDGFGSIKEIKILHREDFFERGFGVSVRERGRVLALSSTAGALPRLFFEVVSMVALLLLVAVLVIRGAPIEEVTPTLGIFAVAAFRLMPSANRIVAQAANLKYGAAAIDHVFDALMAAALPSSGAGSKPLQPLQDSLIVRDVTFYYPGRCEPALDNVSLHIARGEMIGLVGASGSGKSTLVDIILGLHAPQQGAVLADGVDIAARVQDWQQSIGYVPQAIYLADESVRRNIAFGVDAPMIDSSRINDAVALAHLDDVLAALPAGLETVVGERGARISGGQRQRIGIARALYRDPDILVFDEATSALDAGSERRINDTLRGLKGRKTSIIIAHRMTAVRHCDRLVFLDNGRVVAEGSFDVLYRDNDQFRRLVELSNVHPSSEEIRLP